MYHRLIYIVKENMREPANSALGARATQKGRKDKRIFFENDVGDGTEQWARATFSNIPDITCCFPSDSFPGERSVASLCFLCDCIVRF